MTDTSKVPDEPAFPIPDFHFPEGQVQPGHNGMTLRDYFAGQALAGIMGCDDIVPLEVAAVESYRVADEMLKERARIGGAS